MVVNLTSSQIHQPRYVMTAAGPRVEASAHLQWHAVSLELWCGINHYCAQHSGALHRYQAGAMG